MKLPLCHALAVVACLLLAAPASSAKTVATPSPAAATAEARKLIRTGRFDEALGVLRPLAEGRRANADLITTQAKRNLSSRSGIGGVRSAT